jgi:hypothetical protein
MINETWALICEISLWGWIAATIGLILHSFPSRDAFRKRPAAAWGGCLAILFALWIVGMLKA